MAASVAFAAFTGVAGDDRVAINPGRGESLMAPVLEAFNEGTTGGLAPWTVAVRGLREVDRSD